MHVHPSGMTYRQATDSPKEAAGGDKPGDQTYESLAHKGETMTTAAMVTYALRPNRPGPSRTERRLEIDDI